MLPLNQEEILIQLIEKLAKMEGMLLLMSNAKEIASDALDKAESAHKRINELKDDTRDTFNDVKKSIEALTHKLERSEEVCADRFEKIEKEQAATPKMIVATLISSLIGAGVTLAVVQLTGG